MPKKYDPGEAEALFWSNVDQRGPLSAECGTACWLWTGPMSGRQGRALGFRGPAARIAWQLLRGTVGPRLFHLCEHQHCVNPDHQTDEPPEVRFWYFVNKDGPTMPHMDTPCWVWTRSPAPRGYGCFYVRGRYLRAHRASWIFQHGPIPAGMSVLHECDNVSCVRHLYLGTQQQNIQDRVDRNRSNRPVGSKNPQAILTEDDVREIRAMAATNPKRGWRRIVADKYGVTTTSIGNIVTGYSWSKI